MAAVSAATDFAKGLPEEQALRTCRIAMALAERAGLPAEERRAVFFVSLLRFVGCTATAPQMAAALGDELAVSELFAAVDPRDLRAVVAAAATLVGTDHSPPRRGFEVMRFLAAAPAVIREHEVASCEVARLFAERTGLPAPIPAALSQVFERFDGRGHPGASRGEEIALATRVEQVAHAVELLVRTVGPAQAVAGLRRRAGSTFDPVLVELACSQLPTLRADPDDELDQDEVLAAEPLPWVHLSGDAIDAALAAVGAIADLKSAYTRGHSGGVAARAVAAAEQARLPAAEVVLVRRAAWLHDLGRVAVSARVWDKPGELTAAQWEQVRLHPYVTERVVARCPMLAQVAAVAGGHHERTDGSGYHRGGTQLGRPAAVLATADVYQALGEPRPYRPARDATQRAQVLRAEAAAGRLPVWAVDAVLAGPGGSRPAGTAADQLTPREVEVLALVARGATNRAAAETLGISAKTVNAHLEHIFTKLGVTTRGAAAFCAVERGLL
jgi:HD-GYP domain-containing protein (c-di-GMP phosphodiesterase class II)